MAASLDYLMRREGYRVTIVAEGAEALAAVEAAPPDLVLLDCLLPGLSGFQLCEAVRANPALSGVRILMLTVRARDTDIARGLGAGADGYMTKPFSTRELAARVRELLE